MRRGRIRVRLLTVVAAVTIFFGACFSVNAAVPTVAVDIDAILAAVADGSDPVAALTDAVGKALSEMAEADADFAISESDLQALVSSVMGQLSSAGMSFPADADAGLIGTVAASVAGVEPATGAGGDGNAGGDAGAGAGQQTLRDIAGGNAQDKGPQVRQQVAQMAQETIGDNGPASGI